MNKLETSPAWSQTCMAGHALRPLILSVRT